LEKPELFFNEKSGEDMASPYKFDTKYYKTILEAIFVKKKNKVSIPSKSCSAKGAKRFFRGAEVLPN